ncbi:zinc finger CCCH domain-containing protein 67-like isoform X2 [Cornus florida]|uniref:zinc finger CCCH domain-containing protein 67-like isoform X2 n=1 Tax=Cornus florida TaxID=4283 RepID=UPI00289E9209|nr:zinc finger CCCH domain-containing protein 67-like isoform X2 [Cornus florida]
MEGAEENSMSKPYSVEGTHESHQEHQKELGLGFQSTDSSHLLDTDPVLDPPPLADDLDQRTMNEGHQNRQTINEELQDQETVEELQNQQDFNEELFFQQIIIEEFQKLTMEEENTVYADREEDVKSEENELSERDVEHEEYDNWNDGNQEDKMVNYDENKNVEMDFKNYYERNDIYNDNDKSENEEEEGFGGDSTDMAGSKDGKYRRYHYPLRPDAEDCSYYMKTGNCKFGSNCKFNHPLRRRNQGAKEKVKDMEENTERPGQIECKYYLTSGGCKFGKACRYNHSRGKTQIAPILELNFLGLPIRSGEKECPYYMRNGSCKYGSNCRFNHPDPTAVGGGDPSGFGNNGSVSLQGASQSSASWSSPRTLNETAPFVPMLFPPTQGVPSSAEWNGYQDQNICSHYNRYGICKFGPACKFDHPVNYSDSASSEVSGSDHPPLFLNSVIADGATMAGGGNGN